MNNAHIPKLKQLDGRTILMITIIACFVTFLAPDQYSHALFTLFLLILMCLSGYWKQSLCFAIVYIIIVGWLTIGIYNNIVFPSPLFLALIYKIIMPFIPAYMLNKIPSGQLTAGLRKLPIPQKILMVLIVMLRFVPTVSQEFKAVRDAMKIRGFLSSFGNVIRHPLGTLEYAVVPMVFRSLKISDELTASAIVRGIECPGNKDSYYVSTLTGIDLEISIITVLFAVVCIVII